MSHDPHCEKKHGLPCQCRARAIRPLVTWLTWIHVDMARPDDDLTVLALIEDDGEKYITTAWIDGEDWFNDAGVRLTGKITRWADPELPH